MMLIDYVIHLYLKITKKRIDYEKYLKSRHWKKLRAKTLKRFNYRCCICGYKRNLEIHHSTYYDDDKNSILYWERKSQVVCLCYRCHMVVHKFIITPKNKREAIN